MSKLSILAAALALLVVAAPARAQIAYPVSATGELTIQNNRNVPVTVYLDVRPFERQLGTIEPMRTTTFTLPKHLLREGSTVELLLQPRGELPMKAQGIISGRGTQLGLVLPATPAQEKDSAREMLAWERGHAAVAAESATMDEEIED